MLCKITVVRRWPVGVHTKVTPTFAAYALDRGAFAATGLPTGRDAF